MDAANILIDLTSACIPQNHLLEMDAKRASAPTWETVRYMVSAIQYGGRITDEFDKLLMDTYAEKYFQQVRQIFSPRQTFQNHMHACR